MQNLKLISLSDTCRTVTLSRVTIWKLVRDGVFPKPVPIHGRRIGFLETEINDWIAGRVAERDEVAR